MDLLGQGFVYLVSAVVSVPIANRLGLGSVLGYLIAGIVIGPVFGIVGAEATEVRHFAEFGVVMMLFLVGLELQPSVLWRMRHQILGLGCLQVLLSMLVLAGAAAAFGMPWRTSLAIGMVLALSSTAIVLQTLNEKGWMATVGGQSSFAVLLTQDIAVIPMLALMPLLALGGGHGDPGDPHAGHGAPSGGALDALPGWGQALVILAAIVAIVFVGRNLMRPVFRFIAESKLREIFTAAALTLVIGIELLMDFVGLSPALGTFLAGVVLSDSEYRHELESDLQPFKGLLLGLFFLTVGAGIDFAVLFGAPGTILGLALGVILVKMAVLYGLAIAFGLHGADRWLFTMGLAQAGEFAFVLFGFALGAGVLDAQLAQLLVLSVAISMLVTPGLFLLYEKGVAPRLVRTDDRPADEIDSRGTVVLAGIGRFGQIISRMLLTNGHPVVVLDQDPDTIENLSRLGIRTYYGDATRPDLLHAAGLDEAGVFIAALDDRDKQTSLVEHVARTYPHVSILARARDRHHVYELQNAGAHVVERELFEGALSLGRAALQRMGAHPHRAEVQSRTFRRHDREMLDDLRAAWNEGGFDSSYVDAMRANYDALHDIMQVDRLDRHERSERGWTPPPKGDGQR